MSTHGRHTSRAARTQAARELDAARARTRAWLSITAACVLLGLASPLVLPPLTVAFAALAALAASRWRHYHRAASTLARRLSTVRLPDRNIGHGGRSSRTPTLTLTTDPPSASSPGEGPAEGGPAGDGTASDGTARNGSPSSGPHPR